MRVMTYFPAGSSNAAKPSRAAVFRQGLVTARAVSGPSSGVLGWGGNTGSRQVFSWRVSIFASGRGGARGEDNGMFRRSYDRYVDRHTNKISGKPGANSTHCRVHAGAHFLGRGPSTALKAPGQVIQRHFSIVVRMDREPPAPAYFRPFRRES